MAAPLRIAVVLLALGVLAPSPLALSPAPVPLAREFTLTLPVSAGPLDDLTGSAASVPGSEDVPSASEAATLPVSISGAASFPAVEPGGSPVRVTLTLSNDGVVPLRVTASASALVGPYGASIPASYLQVLTGSGASLLASPVNLGTLAPGASTTLAITLTPPSGDVQYVPAGTYRGTLTLTGEAA